jgi:TatD DNase family protein
MENAFPPYTDLHTHLFSADPAVWAVRSFHQQEKREEEQHAGPRSVGLHPWFLSPENLEEDWAWLERRSLQPEVVAIGEAGLDRLQGPLMPFQEMAFMRQLQLAEARQKPLIVHCVRAWDELERLLLAGRPSIAVVVHGFQKNEETMGRLLEAGAFFSFGAAILREGSTAERSLRAVPAGRFFLETDDDQNPIQAIHERAAAIRGLDAGELSLQLHENLKNIGIHG